MRWTIRSVRRALVNLRRVGERSWRDVVEAVGLVCIVVAIGLGQGLPLGVGAAGAALLLYSQFGGRR